MGWSEILLVMHCIAYSAHGMYVRILLHIRHDEESWQSSPANMSLFLQRNEILKQIFITNFRILKLILFPWISSLKNILFQLGNGAAVPNMPNFNVFL